MFGKEEVVQPGALIVFRLFRPIGDVSKLNTLSQYMGVSENSGTPQIIHFNRVFHYKPSILGYPYFWKPPYDMYRRYFCAPFPEGLQKKWQFCSS